jgi:hypothetical protein
MMYKMQISLKEIDRLVIRKSTGTHKTMHLNIGITVNQIMIFYNLLRKEI